MFDLGFVEVEAGKEITGRSSKLAEYVAHLKANAGKKYEVVRDSNSLALQLRGAGAKVASEKFTKDGVEKFRIQAVWVPGTPDPVKVPLTPEQEAKKKEKAERAKQKRKAEKAAKEGKTGAANSAKPAAAPRVAQTTQKA